MPSDVIVPYSLDDYFQSTPIGSIDKAIGNNLYGLNHTQVQGAVPSNKDSYGLTFIVRPQLNMQADNIRNSRLFYPLLTDNTRSMQRFVRCMLDPRLIEGYKFLNAMSPQLACPIVDNQNAFISVLTNNLNSVSGWPDIVAPTYTSKPGLYNEAISFVDGLARNYEVFDLDLSFRNTRGDPILYMFYIWLHYTSMVFEGRLVPYWDYLTEREIDYTTRIYRLVLDQHKNKVTKIAATGACFPNSVPTGSFFDFNAEKPYNDQNKDITIRFKCMGAEYQDDILIKEFNDTVEIFNPSMSDKNRERDMVSVSRNLRTIFNNRGYPRIDPSTNQFEIWVPKQLFADKTSAFLNTPLGQTMTPSVPVEEDDFSGD